MTSSARDKRYGRRGGGWVDDPNAGHRLDGPACSICGQPMLLGSMMFPPPDPASRWCRETPQAMRSASEIVRRVHLDVRRGHRGSV